MTKSKTFKAWHKKARKVMYWLFVSVSNSIIVDIETPKETWDILVKLHSTDTTMQKMYLKQALHNV